MILAATPYSASQEVGYKYQQFSVHHSETLSLCLYTHSHINIFFNKNGLSCMYHSLFFPFYLINNHRSSIIVEISTVLPKAMKYGLFTQTPIIRPLVFLFLFLFSLLSSQFLRVE